VTKEPSTRRAREKEETQRRILDAARELFGAEGYEAVTMRQIADRIEYTPTALYFHFRDKEALFHRLCAEDFGKLAARFQVLARVPDPVERLRMLGRGYVTFALEHPNHYRLLFMGAAAPASKGAAVTGATGPTPDPYAFILQATTEAIRDERLRPDLDPELTAQTLWAGLHGVAALALAAPGGQVAWRPVDARAEQMLEALLAGLASR